MTFGLENVRGKWRDKGPGVKTGLLGYRERRMLSTIQQPRNWAATEFFIVRAGNEFLMDGYLYLQDRSIYVVISPTDAYSSVPARMLYKLS